MEMHLRLPATARKIGARDALDLVNPWRVTSQAPRIHSRHAPARLNREAKAQGQMCCMRSARRARALEDFPSSSSSGLRRCSAIPALLVGLDGRDLPSRHRAAAAPHAQAADRARSPGARIAFRYRGSFPAQHVVDLLEDLNVSQMRPLAVEIEGEIVGHASRVPSGARTWCCAMKRPHVSALPLVDSSRRLLFALRSADRLVASA